MSWNTGTYTRSDGSSGCANDEAANIGILSSKMDDRLNELTTGVNTCLAKDGQNAPSGNLPMGGFVHTNVGAATATTHYAQASQAINSSLVWGGTSGGSANAQTISLPVAPGAYATGMRLAFVAGYTPTAAFTLNVNSLGAKNVYKAWGKVAATKDDIQAGQLVEVMYDGTQFVLCERNTQNGIVLARVTPVTYNNTSVEQTFFSFSVPANLLGSTRKLQFDWHGFINNATAATSVDVKIRGKFGGVVLFNAGPTPITFTASASYPCFGSFNVIGQNATNTCASYGQFTYSTGSTAGTKTEFRARPGGMQITSGGALTLDLTTAQTFEMSIEMTVANANITADIFTGELRLI